MFGFPERGQGAIALATLTVVLLSMLMRYNFVPTGADPGARSLLGNVWMHLRAVRLLCLLVVGAGTAFAESAKTLPALDPGLWQWTTTVVSGAKTPTAAQLSQLPESVRAAVEAHARNATLPHSSQGCLTEQKLRDGFNLTHRAQDNCEFRINASSPTRFDELSTCHTAYFGDILAHITFSVADRGTLHGSIEMHSIRDPAPEIIKLEGKHISADCGSVKP